MNQSIMSRYGWVLALLAIGALWLRIENQPISSNVQAAPSASNASEAPLPPTTMAVIDVAVIFKGCRQFNAEMARVKEDIQAFDGVVRREAAELKELGDQMAQAKPGSDAYKRLELQSTAKTADLQARVGVKNNELLKVEAEAYFDTYQKLQSAAKIVARKRKIGFVLRYNSDEMKRDDRNSILQGVNRAVITFPTDNDITALVLAELNRS